MLKNIWGKEIILAPKKSLVQEIKAPKKLGPKSVVKIRTINSWDIADELWSKLGQEQQRYSGYGQISCCLDKCHGNGWDLSLVVFPETYL